MIFFTYPWMLWGILAASLPWILRRRTPEHVEDIPFGLFNFLQESEPRRWLSRRAQEILLLIIRTLLITAVILAMAGPRWESAASAGAAQETGNTSILLIDLTSSMGNPKKAASAASKALLAVEEVIASARDTQAWDIWGWRGDIPSTPQIVKIEATQNQSVLAARLGDLEQRTITGPLDEAIRKIEGDAPISPPILFITDRQRSTWHPWLENPTPQPLPKRTIFRAAAIPSEMEVLPWLSFVETTPQPWGSGSEAEIVIRIHEPSGSAVDSLQLRVIGPQEGEAPLLDKTIEATPEISPNLTATRDERLLIPIDTIATEDPSSPNRRLASIEVQLVNNGRVLDSQKLNTPVFSDYPVGVLATGKTLRPLVLAMRPSTEGISFFSPLPLGEMLGTGGGGTQRENSPLLVIDGQYARTTPILFEQGVQAVEQGGMCVLIIPSQQWAPASDSVAAFLEGPLGWTWTRSGQRMGEIETSWRQGDGLAQVLRPWSEALWKRENSPDGSVLCGETGQGQVLIWQEEMDANRHLLSRHQIGQGTLILADLDINQILRKPEFAPWILESLKDLLRHEYKLTLQPSWVQERWERDPRQITDADITRLGNLGLSVEKLRSQSEAAKAWSSGPASLVGAMLIAALALALLELVVGNATA